MTTLTDPGTSEATKAAVHGALGALVALCCAYNVCAWVRRREPHLAINVLVYGSLLAFEAAQIRRHAATLRLNS